MLFLLSGRNGKAASYSRKTGLELCSPGCLCPGFYWFIRTLFKRNARALLVLGQVMHDML